MQPEAILETSLYVDDIDEAEAFYQRVLNLQVIGKDSQRHLFFQCGGSILLLFLAEATRMKTSEVPEHGASGSGHLAFRIARDDIARWRAHLQTHQVEIESEIAWPAGGYSLYFRDPAGNSLELATATTWPVLM